MRSFERIAAVTDVLCDVLRNAVQVALPGARVQAGPPLDPSRDPLLGVVVTLRGVRRNVPLARCDLPTRLPGGTVVQRPTAAIDLDYLFSFYGDHARLEPQVLMGQVVSVLHAAPALTADAIRAAIRANPEGYAATSGLLEQVDRVTFEMVHLSIDEQFRLWSMFQVPYSLAITYTASVVLLEADVEPAPALPVDAVGLHVSTLLPARVSARAGDVLPGQPLRITGERLPPGDAEVALGKDLVVKAQRAGRDLLEVTLTPDLVDRAGLAAGEATVHLLLPARGGAGPARVPVAFVLRPRVLEATATRGRDAVDVEVTVSPPVEAGRAVELLLNEADARGRIPRSVRLAATPAARTGSVHFSGDVPPGTYVVRVQTEGLVSTLERTAPHAPPRPQLVIR